VIYKNFKLLACWNKKNVAGGSHFKTWKIDFHFDFSWNLSARQTDKKTTQLLQGQKVTSLPALLCTNVYPSLKICAAENPPVFNAILHPAFELSLMLVIEYIHGTRTPTKNWIFLSRWDYSGGQWQKNKSVGLKTHSLRRTRWKNWTTKSTYKMLKWLFKIPSAMLKNLDKPKNAYKFWWQDK